MRLVVRFSGKKFIVVVPSNATIQDAKDEIVKVYKGISPSTTTEHVSELSDSNGCILFDKYEVKDLLTDMARVYALRCGEENTTSTVSTPLPYTSTLPAQLPTWPDLSAYPPPHYNALNLLPFHCTDPVINSTHLHPPAPSNQGVDPHFYNSTPFVSNPVPTRSSGSRLPTSLSAFSTPTGHKPPGSSKNNPSNLHLAKIQTVGDVTGQSNSYQLYSGAMVQGDQGNMTADTVCNDERNGFRDLEQNSPNTNSVEHSVSVPRFTLSQNHQSDAERVLTKPSLIPGCDSSKHNSSKGRKRKSKSNSSVSPNSKTIVLKRKRKPTKEHVAVDHCTDQSVKNGSVIYPGFSSDLTSSEEEVEPVKKKKKTAQTVQAKDTIEAPIRTDVVMSSGSITSGGINLRTNIKTPKQTSTVNKVRKSTAPLTLSFPNPKMDEPSKEPQVISGVVTPCISASSPNPSKGDSGFLSDPKDDRTADSSVDKVLPKVDHIGSSPTSVDKTSSVAVISSKHSVSNPSSRTSASAHSDTAYLTPTIASSAITAESSLRINRLTPTKDTNSLLLASDSILPTSGDHYESQSPPDDSDVTHIQESQDLFSHPHRENSTSLNEDRARSSSPVIPLQGPSQSVIGRQRKLQVNPPVSEAVNVTTATESSKSPSALRALLLSRDETKEVSALNCKQYDYTTDVSSVTDFDSSSCKRSKRKQQMLHKLLKFKKSSKVVSSDEYTPKLKRSPLKKRGKHPISKGGKSPLVKNENSPVRQKLRAPSPINMEGTPAIKIVSTQSPITNQGTSPVTGGRTTTLVKKEGKSPVRHYLLSHLKTPSSMAPSRCIRKRTKPTIVTSQRPALMPEIQSDTSISRELSSCGPNTLSKANTAISNTEVEHNSSEVVNGLTGSDEIDRKCDSKKISTIAIDGDPSTCMLDNEEKSIPVAHKVEPSTDRKQIAVSPFNSSIVSFEIEKDGCQDVKKMVKPTLTEAVKPDVRCARRRPLKTADLTIDDLVSEALPPSNKINSPPVRTDQSSSTTSSSGSDPEQAYPKADKCILFKPKGRQTPISMSKSTLLQSKHSHSSSDSGPDVSDRPMRKQTKVETTRSQSSLSMESDSSHRRLELKSTSTKLNRSSIRTNSKDVSSKATSKDSKLRAQRTLKLDKEQSSSNSVQSGNPSKGGTSKVVDLVDDETSDSPASDFETEQANSKTSNHSVALTKTQSNVISMSKSSCLHSKHSHSSSDSGPDVSDRPMRKQTKVETARSPSTSSSLESDDSCNSITKLRSQSKLKEVSSKNTSKHSEPGDDKTLTKQSQTNSVQNGDLSKSNKSKVIGLVSRNLFNSSDSSTDWDSSDVEVAVVNSPKPNSNPLLHKTKSKTDSKLTPNKDLTSSSDLSSDEDSNMESTTHTHPKSEDTSKAKSAVSNTSTLKVRDVQRPGRLTSSRFLFTARSKLPATKNSKALNKVSKTPVHISDSSDQDSSSGWSSDSSSEEDDSGGMSQSRRGKRSSLATLLDDGQRVYHPTLVGLSEVESKDCSQQKSSFKTKSFSSLKPFKSTALRTDQSHQRLHKRANISVAQVDDVPLSQQEAEFAKTGSQNLNVLLDNEQLWG